MTDHAEDDASDVASSAETEEASLAESGSCQAFSLFASSSSGGSSSQSSERVDDGRRSEIRSTQDSPERDVKRVSKKKKRRKHHDEESGDQSDASLIYVQLSPEEFEKAARLCAAMQDTGNGGISLKKRRGLFTPSFTDSFIGLKMVDWLQLNTDGPTHTQRSREQAALLASLLARGQFIHRAGDRPGRVRNRYLQNPLRVDDYEFWTFAEPNYMRRLRPIPVPAGENSSAAVPSGPLPQHTGELRPEKDRIKRKPGAWMGSMWWLQHVGLALFSTVMASGGLGLLFRTLERVWPGTVASFWAEIFFIAAAVQFVFWSILYILKAATFWTACVEEFNDPILGNFAGAIALDLNIFAQWLLPHNQVASTILWWLAVLGGSCIAIWLVSRLWLKQALSSASPSGQSDSIGQLAPPIFIGVVPLTISPITGVPLGNVEVSNMVWALGLFFYLWIMPLVIYRLAYAYRVPPKMWPTLWITLAPPSLLYHGYRALWSAGKTAEEGMKLDFTARVLFGGALFVFCNLVVMQIRLTLRQRPLMSNTLWAFVFPISAFSAASVDFYGATREFPMAIFAITVTSVTLVVFVCVACLAFYFILSCRLFTPAVRTS